MLRVESYSVGDGLMVAVVGQCTVAHGGTGRCEGDRVSVTVESSRVERDGLRVALVDALVFLLSQDEDIIEYLIH